MGKLHRCLVKPDTLELTEQCKEETGLTVDELLKAEALDKVLQQVSLIYQSPLGNFLECLTSQMIRITTD